MHFRSTCSTHPSRGDVADELAQAVRANLTHGLECVALALSEPSFHARRWADGVGQACVLVAALHVALVEMESMVICRRERAMVRRLIDAVMAMAAPTDTVGDGPGGDTQDGAAHDITGGIAR